jgi:hypothetical protein
MVFFGFGFYPRWLKPAGICLCAVGWQFNLHRFWRNPDLAQQPDQK